MGSEKTECANCLEIFNGTTAFDAHRTGAGTHRRCLTPIEMRQQGMIRGRWDRWQMPELTPQHGPRKPAIQKGG